MSHLSYFSKLAPAHSAIQSEASWEKGSFIDRLQVAVNKIEVLKKSDEARYEEAMRVFVGGILRELSDSEPVA